YLLGELAIWPARELVSSEAAHKIYAEYIRRRGELIGDTDIKAARAQLENSMPPSIRHHAQRPDSPATSVRGASSNAAPTAQLHFPQTEPRLHWLAEFLEAHWLKLLAALAALLIFAGMKQLMGWAWVSRLAVTLIPLLPISLTGMFYYFGMRVRGRGSA